MDKRNSNYIKQIFYGFGGIYLLYYVYSLVTGILEGDSLTPYIGIMIVVFAFAGVVLVLKSVQLYIEDRKAAKEERTEREKMWAEEKEKREEEKRRAEAAEAARRANSCRAVILAAGKGTRMKSDLPKVLHTIDDKPMALYVKEAACAAGAEEVCYVVGYQREKVRMALADVGVCFAVQEEQLGTGHALKCAMDFVGTEGNVFVLCGDTPLITAHTLQLLLGRHRMKNNAVTVLSAKLENPYGYGRIVRDEEGNFLKSVEEKDASPEEKRIKESNVGMYVFRAADLPGAIDLLRADNAQGEYYLPDLLMILQSQGKKADAYCIEETPEIMGVNTPEQLEAAAAVIHARAAKE